MKALFELYSKYSNLSLEVYHSSILDWVVTIKHKPKDTILVHVQSNDYEYALAKAQVLFKDWLNETKGGY